MGWLTNRTEPEAPAGYLSGMIGPSNPVYPVPGFLSYANHGFGRNELVYACIMEKATSMPEAHLRVYGPDGMGDPLENHPLRMLLANPNPVVSEFELFELSVTHLDLAGMAAWEIVSDRSGRPAQIWPLRPDLIRFVVQPDGTVKYWYDIGHGMVPLGPVVLFKYPNPVDMYVGQPPLRPAVRAVALDNEATDFVTGLLQNRAVPGTVVTTQQEIDDATVKRLRARWNESFGGSRRGDVAFMQAGMDVKVLGLNLDQLEFPDLRSIDESRICMTLGVPPVLVGAKVGLDRSTFTNYGEARRSLWEETIMPLQRRFKDAIVRDLLPLVQPGPRPRRTSVRWDTSQVLALRDSETEIWTRATNALRAGAITVNMFLRMVSLPEQPGADVFLRPAGVIPTDASGRPMEGAVGSGVDGMTADQLNAFIDAGMASMRDRRVPATHE